MQKVFIYKLTIQDIIQHIEDITALCTSNPECAMKRLLWSLALKLEEDYGEQLTIWKFQCTLLRIKGKSWCNLPYVNPKTIPMRVRMRRKPHCFGRLPRLMFRLMPSKPEPVFKTQQTHDYVAEVLHFMVPDDSQLEWDPAPRAFQLRQDGRRRNWYRPHGAERIRSLGSKISSKQGALTFHKLASPSYSRQKDERGDQWRKQTKYSEKPRRYSYRSKLSVWTAFCFILKELARYVNPEPIPGSELSLADWLIGSISSVTK